MTLGWSGYSDISCRSRSAALALNVFNDYTYTIETIIQAGQRNMAVTSVPIRVNDELRPSRLMKSIPAYIRRSVATIVRIGVVYRPFPFFLTLGFLLLSGAAALGARFLVFYAMGRGAGHVQSLILVGILAGLGFQTIMAAFLADVKKGERFKVKV